MSSDEIRMMPRTAPTAIPTRSRMSWAACAETALAIEVDVGVLLVVVDTVVEDEAGREELDAAVDEGVVDDEDDVVDDDTSDVVEDVAADEDTETAEDEGSDVLDDARVDAEDAALVDGAAEVLPDVDVDANVDVGVDEAADAVVVAPVLL